LNDEQIKILKLMNEMTTRIDMTEFAKKAEITTAQIGQQLNDLAKEGYLKKIGGGFAITERGKTALKSTTKLPENLKFQFYIEVGKPTNLSANSVKEFLDAVLNVDIASLEFHLCRGDFENWFQAAIADLAFVDELGKIKKSNLKEEHLRKALVKALEQKFAL
jgi:predicted transcriptional regulator